MVTANLMVANENSTLKAVFYIILKFIIFFAYFGTHNYLAYTTIPNTEKSCSKL